MRTGAGLATGGNGAAAVGVEGAAVVANVSPAGAGAAAPFEAGVPCALGPGADGADTEGLPLGLISLVGIFVSSSGLRQNKGRPESRTPPILNANCRITSGSAQVKPYG